MPLSLEVTEPLPLEPLTKEDLRDCLQALRSLYAAHEMTTFPRVSLQIINHLIPRARFSSYNEIDVRRSDARVFYEPENILEKAESYRPLLWKHRAEHPLMRRMEAGLDKGIWKISDFLSREDIHTQPFYREVFKGMDIEDTIAVSLESQENFRVFYAINGEPFTERDRAVCACLMPHLIQAFENAVAFTRAQAWALVSTGVVNDTGKHGLLLMDRRGRIVHANDLASRHLAAAFENNGAEIVPPELQRWSESGGATFDRPAPPLEVSRHGATVHFRSAPADAEHWIIVSRLTTDDELVEGIAAGCGVTTRQAEVLLWLSRGKTNAEIGTILALSERTVAKHLQNLFATLGVENRHSATLKVMEVTGLN